MHSARFHAMLVASLAAAGCSGGSGSLPSALPVVPKSPGATHATFVVKIPAKPQVPSSKRRHYITSNVQGIAFNVADATNPDLGGLTFYPLTPTSPGCTGTVPSGITCTLEVVAAPGSDTFVVTLYDSTEINGAYAISTGTVTQTIAAQASNTISVITDGVPTWAAMGFATPYPTASGAYPLTIDVADPSGDIIVGSYDAPLTLSDSDGSGVTALSKTTLSQASDAIGVTVNWNGVALPSGATITMNSTDSVLVNETGTTMMASTQMFPGREGPEPSQGAYYFANASSAAQPLTITGASGSTGPFTVSSACNAFVTISGASPNFTITPLATTAPPSGGIPQFSPNFGTCQFTIADSLSEMLAVDVMVGQ